MNRKTRKLKKIRTKNKMRFHGFKKGDEITSNFGYGMQSKDIETFFNEGYRIKALSSR